MSDDTPNFDVLYRRREERVVYYPQNREASHFLFGFIPDDDGGFGFSDKEPDHAWFREGGLTLGPRNDGPEAA